MSAAPTLAVWKFASCDGCQLSILDCEDELLAIADRIRIAQFPEASRAVVAGPYDISLVEGSVTTPLTSATATACDHAGSGKQMATRAAANR